MKALVCELCGSNYIIKQDGCFVCQHCGTKYSVEEARKMMNDTQEIEEQTEKGEKTKDKNRRKTLFTPERRKKTIVFLIIAIVFIAIAVISVFVVHSFLSPEGVAKRYLNAYQSGDVVKVQSLSAFDYYDWITQEYEDEEEFFWKQSIELGEDITKWNDLSKANVSNYKESLEDSYGKYTVEYRVKKTRDLSIRQLEKDDFVKYVANKHGFNLDSVKAVKRVFIKKIINGEDKKTRTEYVVTVARVNTGWKAIDYDWLG